MSNPRYDTFVAVFTNDGEKINTRFVTDLPARNVAEWNAGKPAMRIPETYAKDIVYGLTLNGHAAGVVKVLHGVEFTNPKE
jgi:hypothetical protein